MRLKIGFFALILTFATSAFAQKNELAVTGGGYFPANATLDVQAAPVVEFSYARRLAGVPFVSLYAEIPVAKTFDIGIGSTSSNYSALFVAPGLKLKLAPSFPMSPWIAVGGGVAHFSANSVLAGTSGGRTDNSGVVDFGGGIDMKVFPFISLRAQARDYYSGNLRSVVASPLASGRQHNVIASGGLVLRF